MSDRDYYEILGLAPQSDGAMVDQAYWHLARKYQQLAVTNPRAQHLLDELNESYGVLGNPRLRQQYDAFREDVLIRQGMVARQTTPRRRKREQQPAQQQQPAASGPSLKDKARGLSRKTLPTLSTEQRSAYFVALVIASLGIAGAWQGVNLMFVVTALVTGLAFSLLPTVRRHVSEMNLSMPSIGVLNLPNIGETQGFRDQFGFGRKDDGIDPDTLRASTATTIARWRNSVGLREVPRSPAGLDTTLVDIFDDEREIDDPEEPLAAVIDILRGSRNTPSDVS